MKTKRGRDTVTAETIPTVEGAGRVAKQWESFPQPAGWSVKWDFEELEKPPRRNDWKGHTEHAEDKA